jgi:NAD+ synthase (glutamine-hydrolysing)
MASLKISLAQINFTIGDFEGNTSKIADTLFTAKRAGIDLVVFSELSVCGYMPEDLLDFPWFIDKCEQSLEAVAESCQGISAIVGGVMRQSGVGKQLQNVACFMQNGRIEKVIAKSLLPTYDVFSEARYFQAASSTEIIVVKDTKIGITICEDLWHHYNLFEYERNPIEELVEQGAELIINPSASPYYVGKEELRNKVFQEQSLKYQVPIVHVNQVGMHTELLFDGRSKVYDSNGSKIISLPAYEEAKSSFQFENQQIKTDGKTWVDFPKEIADLYHTLIFGIRDYFKKMGFTKAVLGSSGGIDSALVQTLASKALGAENVMAVLMPSKYSSEGSISDAIALSENLGNSYHVLPITDVHKAYEQTLVSLFQDTTVGLAEENIQARSRAILLMAISNKFGNILLNTSNKSEMAVGYSTLYGDLCGSLSVIGDVYKTKVYELCTYINQTTTIIPQNIIEKEPSAELRPDQKDSDSLPEYAVLDAILRLYIEEQRGLDEIIIEGYDPTMVQKIIEMVNRNEYKRYQAPPIIKVSSKSFGRGRSMPLVAKYQ